MADDRDARIAQLEAEVATLRQREATLVAERNEALEQQTATAEVLRVIASAPTDLQAVLDAITASAARLCGAEQVGVRVVEGGQHRLVAFYGSEAAVPIGDRRPLDRNTIAGRAIVDRTTIHAPDNLAIPDITYPDPRFRRSGATLAAPLLRQGEGIGAIFLVRWEPGPFSDRQIALLETFADQAVIAIENARLFQELEGRNAELQESNRQVTEALDQQTATADVLRVIASSPTDLQAVLDAIAESAEKLCGADIGTINFSEDAGQRIVALSGNRPSQNPRLTVGALLPLTRGTVSGRPRSIRRPST